ncbi:eukaryotic translation initiation factor [Artemisia annua]|uniref:Eukaryotic translation initiation factor n=1 Tax=Artemisia annua TaxID=35608 RepID=A0A2U1NUU5_ARTAN|nr:eukaryotic translation initiation factor [Artemisia annua]
MEMELNTKLNQISRILNRLSSETYDIVKRLIVNIGITTVDTLKGVVSLIFDKAVLDNHNCNVHARLCYDFITELPSFPSTEPGANNITFKRLLLKKVEDTFDRSEGGPMGEFIFLIALHHQKVISDSFLRRTFQKLNLQA